MSGAATRETAKVFYIEDEPLFIRENQQGAPMWTIQQLVTQEGDPTVPRRRRINDWSRGLGDSRGAFRGSVEYAENAYLGAMGRILPGPEIGIIETNHAADVTDIIAVTVPADRILSCGGTTVCEINPSTKAVASTNTLSGTLLSMCLFDEQVAIAAGDSTDYYVRAAAGTYSQNSISKKARCFGLVNGDLARGYDNTRSLCSATNITSVNNWSTELSIGDLSGMVNQIFSHNRWEYVLKDEGLYSFDDDTSEESNLLTDLETFKSSSNRWVFKWYDHVYVCTEAGLYRYIQQGAARTVGIEEAELNESEIGDVYPTAGVAFGRVIYVAFTDGTTTWIMQGRRTREGDASFGSPITFTSVIYKFTGLCKAMRQSGLGGTATVYFGKGGDVGYFGVTRTGKPKTYRDDGTVTVWMPPTDFESPFTVKFFRGVEVVGRNASAARTIQFKAKMDGGSANNVGSTITAFTSTFAERFWTAASNDEGRVMQLGVEMVCDSAATVPEIRDIVINYEERPVMVPGAVVGLRLRDFDHEGDASSRYTALGQREWLEGLLDGGPVTVRDPWGRQFTARISHYEGEIAYQRRGDEPMPDLVIAIRELEYS